MNKPEHIAIILDGNRRWARAKGLPENEGHKNGLENINNLVEWCLDADVKILSLYCLSVENLKRSKSELDFLFEYLKIRVEEIIEDVKENKEKGIKYNVLGNFELLPKEIVGKINDAINASEKEWKNDKPKLLVNLCICYGGRQDIVRAAHAVVERKLEINEENINANLFTKGTKDVDLLIRTGGEQRLSNFLLWQASYAELYFTDKMWPEFAKEDFTVALEWFGNRQRRFGK
jgi:undecaprenyl diphosphate synthase